MNFFDKEKAKHDGEHVISLSSRILLTLSIAKKKAEKGLAEAGEY